MIAANLFMPGDYGPADSEGRTIETLLIDGFLFNYWIDHASHEVRVTHLVHI